MPSQTYSQAEMLVIGAAVQTQLAMSTLHLFNTPVSISPTTPLATFTAVETTFPGYTAPVISAAEAPYIPPTGGVSIAVPGNTFVCSGSPGDTLIGWFLVLADATTLFAAGQFDAPYTVGGAGDGLNLDLIFTFVADQMLLSVLNGQPQ